MPINVNVRGSMEKIIADSARLKSGIREKAVVRALNRVGAMSMTYASRALREDGYNFKSSEIKDAMHQAKASASNLVTTIKVRRKTKSLMDFNPRQTKDGVIVRIHGQAKLIKGAFIAQRLNGRDGVFIEDKRAGKIILRHKQQYKRGSRGGWQSLPARKLYGPSVGGAIVNQRIASAITEFMATKFADRLKHEIKNLTR